MINKDERKQAYFEQTYNNLDNEALQVMEIADCNLDQALKYMLINRLDSLIRKN